MKKKRYFWDYCDNFLNIIFSRRGNFFVALFLVILIFISSLISYNAILVKHENELDAYSESIYQTYLNEIADNIVQEGIGINLLALPDDVVKYEITSENNEVIFKYHLDNSKNLKFANPPTMTVKLSEGFEIISKSPNYSSEENYIKTTKFIMCFMAVITSFVFLIAFFLFTLIICFILAMLSRNKKQKDLNKIGVPF